MFCNNCGFQIPEGRRFCSKCGSEVAGSDKEPSPEHFSEDSKKSYSSAFSPASLLTKKSLVATVLCIIAITAVAVATVSITRKSKDESYYSEEIKNYLDYIADENDNVSDFLTDTYFSGSFGEYYSGEEAGDIHKIIAETMFRGEKGPKNMSYYYDYYSRDSKDSWKDYFENAIIKDFYRDMDSVYGNWHFDYKIGDAKKLSASKIEELQTDFEDILDSYDSYRKDISDKGDRDDYDEFIESIEKLNVEKAYEVKVNIEIDGDDDSYDDEVEFVVAKIGEEWVIMEGPDFSEFTNP